jgi:hypothetical protein
MNGKLSLLSQYHSSSTLSLLQGLSDVQEGRELATQRHTKAYQAFSSTLALATTSLPVSSVPAVTVNSTRRPLNLMFYMETSTTFFTPFSTVHGTRQCLLFSVALGPFGPRNPMSLSPLASPLASACQT